MCPCTHTEVLFTCNNLSAPFLFLSLLLVVLPYSILPIPTQAIVMSYFCAHSNGCSKPWPYWFHLFFICTPLSVSLLFSSFLELAAYGNYSASKILCLNLLLSNLNLFSFPVPHQRFLLSNWVYDLCRSVVCRFPPLFPISQPFPVFYSVCT